MCRINKWIIFEHTLSEHLLHKTGAMGDGDKKDSPWPGRAHMRDKDIK